MPCQVKGTAFITGGGSGIGKATAQAFAENGIQSIALVDLNIPLLEKTREELLAQFPTINVEALQANVADEASVEDSVRKTIECFGSIDIGINCAGISGTPTPTDRMTLVEWQKVIDVNQTGVWLCQRALIRQMLRQESRGSREGRGVIVNVSSMFGVSGPPGPFDIPHYTAAKHAVVGLTKMDAKAYSRQGIRINAICPGFVDTPIIKQQIESGSMNPAFEMTPLGRPAQVEEISDAILFLSCPMSSYMCGAALVVDGGFTV
ncbi:short chain dehydrogenase/reductase family oxidoreductase [Penicillium brasilianum]|uniref:Short chain dehydrogenase/reductase family oxidoreductase n=1 Tax=Penicillium brasilianum TaxID=104259 RepID=A0A1S9RZ49_PENBI|nr:short chain dehydrogenase/reductase family oxidoreductase [Penicillium brasilianum]